MSFVRFLKSFLQSPSHPTVLEPPCPSLSWDFPGTAECLAEQNAVGFFVPIRAIWGLAGKGTILSEVLLFVFMLVFVYVHLQVSEHCFMSTGDVICFDY